MQSERIRMRGQFGFMVPKLEDTVELLLLDAVGQI